MEDMEANRRICLDMYNRAVESVLPKQLIASHVQVTCSDKNNPTINISNRSYELHHNVYLVGFGKAVLGMAAALLDIPALAQHVVRGVLSVPAGIRGHGRDSCLGNGDVVELFEGAAGNLPDEAALKAAQSIKELVTGLQSANDVLIVLISGGGSALLPLPIDGVTLEEKVAVIKSLSRGGANITELNLVRQHLSQVKGGRLAQMAHPAQVIALILSDIIDSPLQFIASGPTVLPTSLTTRRRTVIDIMNKYHLMSTLPASVRNYLCSDECKEREEEEIAKFSAEYAKLDVSNVVIGDISVALQSAASYGDTSLGLRTFILSRRVSGEARLVGRLYARLAAYACTCFLLHLAESRGDYDSLPALYGHMSSLVTADVCGDLIECDGDTLRQKLWYILKMARVAVDKHVPLCLLCGGEPTVTVRGAGSGGRSTELALSAGITLHELLTTGGESGGLKDYNLEADFNMMILAGGTDGEDGVTPDVTAGAVTYPGQVNSGNVSEAGRCLEDNDSWGFYSSGRHTPCDLLRPGLTGTNVMDLHLLLVAPTARYYQRVRKQTVFRDQVMYL